MTYRFLKAGTALVILCFGVNAWAGGLLVREFDLSDFSNPTVLDNPYWPLLPAGVSSRTLTYIGEGEDECAFNVISATVGEMKMDFTGDFAGATAQIVVDQEWALETCDDTPTDDELSELTFDWYMQDNYGNIWYMGEDSRSFEDDCPSLADLPWGDPWPDPELEEECTDGSWEAGIDDAEPGIVVPSDMPDGENDLTAGTFFFQEFAEDAQDMAKVQRLDATVVLDTGDFEGEYDACRRVKESTLLEPGGSVEHKFYCALESGEAGLLLIHGIGGGPTEAEVLISVDDT